MVLRDEIMNYVTPEIRDRVAAFMAEPAEDGGQHEVYVTPESFRVTIVPAKCLRGTDLRHWNLAVEPVAAHFAVFYDGELDDGWIVTDGGRVLGKDGSAWSYALGSDAAVPAWMAAHVHARLADALDAARDFAPKVTVNGLTAAEVLARHRERNLECCDG